MELLQINDLKRLAIAAAKKAPITYGKETFNAESVDKVLRGQFELLAPDYKSFRRNENTIFELIEESIDEVLPKRVMQQYEQFADVRTIAQGDQAVFRQSITEAARKRAKTFVTRVGLAGRYETFMLDGAELTVQTGAIGAACRIGFEEFLDGRIQFADLTSIILEGMDEYIYAEIAKALKKAVEALPEKNRVTGASFEESKMDTLLAISDAYYGGNSSIYCTREFAATMLPAQAMMSDAMKSTLWDKGMLGNYKGHNIIVLEQSFTDATNSEKVIDPADAYIMPSGVEKPVKIVFEGETAVRTVEDNDDWSRDLQTYKKIGVGVMTNPAICHYVNTSLKKSL